MLFVMGLGLAQVGPSVDELIHQLGSGAFKQREAAMKALLDRPDAEPKLRAAMRSPDAEIARRAAEIVADFEDRPFRELDDAIAKGRVEDAIELVVAWPETKVDDQFWRRIQKLSDGVLTRTKRTSQQSRPANWSLPKDRIKAERFTTADCDPKRRYINLFLRAGEVDLESPCLKGKSDETLWGGTTVFSRGAVRLRQEIIPLAAVFAQDAPSHARICACQNNCFRAHTVGRG